MFSSVSEAGFEAVVKVKEALKGDCLSYCRDSLVFIFLLCLDVLFLFFALNNVAVSFLHFHSILSLNQEQHHYYYDQDLIVKEDCLPVPSSDMDLYDNNNQQDKKPNLTLDLTSGSNIRQNKFHFNESWSGAGALDSTDVERLKFDTPEIERFILSRSGQSLATPTPSLAHQPLQPSVNADNHLNNNNANNKVNGSFEGKRIEEDVTQEQKMFAMGFTTALNEIRSRSASVSSSSRDEPQTTLSQTNNNDNAMLVYNNLSEQKLSKMESNFSDWNGNSTGFGTTSNSVRTRSSVTGGNRGRSQGSSSSSSSSSLSSSVIPHHVNLDDQEKMKLERKRLRNRIAASKCRKRKLEKIAKLEDKVKMIKNENSELNMAISSLRQHVMQLKQDLITHANHGCQIPGYKTTGASI